MIRSAVTVSLVAEAAAAGRSSSGTAFRMPAAMRSNSASTPSKSSRPALTPSTRTSSPSLLDGHGLRNWPPVGTGRRSWVKHRLHLCLPDDAARLKAKTFIRSMIDFAGPLGAPAIIGSMQGRWGDSVYEATAADWLGEALNELGEHAKQYHVPLIYEPLNRYETNMCTTIAAGVQILQGLSTKNVLLLADLFHMNIEEVDIAAALRQGRGHIGHVHFVDSNRRAAGMGAFDVRRSPRRSTTSATTAMRPSKHCRIPIPSLPRSRRWNRSANVSVEEPPCCAID